MKSRVFKFNNDNSSELQKYKMSLNFSPPQTFPPGSEIGLLSLNIYNAVYNISDRIPINNILYLYCNDVSTHGIDAGLLSDTHIEKIDNNPGDNTAIYKITFQNGVYDVDAIDLYIANIIGDVSNGNLKSYSSRKLVVSPDYTTGKFVIEFVNSAYDILFKVDDDVSRNLAYVMGLDMSIDGTNGDKITHDGVEYWSLKTYKTNKGITNSLGLQIGQINNGRSSFNLKLNGNMIDAGITSYLDESDIIFSFLYTRAPSHMERFTPNQIISFPIKQTDVPIKGLTIELVDQNGNLLYDFFDSMFCELLITTP